MAKSALMKLIIDTNKYAGNFEREMCAYCTGSLGDCGVGSEEADEFEKDGNNSDMFSDYIAQVPDEHGCFRPANIEPTPGWVNDGMGDNQPLNSKTKGWKDKYPAYLSVGIYFEKVPPKGHIELLKQRAFQFAKRNNIEIAAFRFIKEETNVTSTEGWEVTGD